jgi:hypothetical protein
VALYARLTSRDRILCGACGARLGLRLAHPDRDQPGAYLAVLPPGWAADERGVWGMTGRALRKERAGRPWSPNSGAPRNWDGSYVTDKGLYQAAHRPEGWAPRDLPVDVRCSSPGCGQRLTLDPARLDLDPNPSNPAERERGEVDAATGELRTWLARPMRGLPVAWPQAL